MMMEKQKTLRKQLDSGNWGDLRIDADMLSGILSTTREFVDKGLTVRPFCAQVEPLLHTGSWWGEKIITNSVTHEIKTIELGNIYRLNTIFHIGCKIIYGARRAQRIMAEMKICPWLEYVAVLDSRTHGIRRAWGGLILRHDDLWWHTHMPPNGWCCRATVHLLTDADLKRRGLTLGIAPADKMHQWQNKLTGEVDQVPDGIDPSWDQDVGGLALVEGVDRTLERFIGMYLRSWYMFDQKVHGE